ncbi:hypothetical protein EVAR_93196_1 [Eumeta japonica]|uniref:Uncharacterized protein n=1 Tax=Eumeta variegata TaxID=151549 RepID=A0A4C1TXX4_EUMVA|nr:hypothetical protein EVAR_93196_1 [Eumeta japonica]
MPVGIVNIDSMMKLRNTVNNANLLRIAQSRLDITPEQQQESSSPRSVRAYTKRKLERRLNRQPKRIVQYESLAFRYDSTINYAADVSVDFGTMNILCQYCDALRFQHEPPGLSGPQDLKSNYQNCYRHQNH